MNADGLDQAFDNLGKAIKITAGLKGTDKSITEVFKMSDIRDEISLVLANYSVVGEPNKHLADYLVDFIAQQVKEARIDELQRATNAHIDFLENKVWFSKYFDKRLEELKGDK